ncbi:MAG: response regulator transcription factor [Thermomicrobiales bacterium]
MKRQRYPDGLSAREVEVLQTVARGLPNAEIADELFISARTVGSHITSIYRKLGVNSRAAATRFAFESGLASSEEGPASTSID